MRSHIVKVVNRRGGLVQGVNFEVSFDDKFAFKVSDSGGTYTVTQIPPNVKTVTVRAFDQQHNLTKKFAAKSGDYEFQFDKAPVSGLDLRAGIDALSDLADTYLRVRPRFLNTFAVLLVTSGVGLASSPWWLPPLYKLLGLAVPTIKPPSEVLSFSLIAVGVILAIAVNWKSLFR